MCLSEASAIHVGRRVRHADGQSASVCIDAAAIITRQGLALPIQRATALAKTQGSIICNTCFFAGPVTIALPWVMDRAFGVHDGTCAAASVACASTCASAGARAAAGAGLGGSLRSVCIDVAAIITRQGLALP